MTAAEVVRKALDDEQARLAKLPYLSPTADSFDDFYGGKLVLGPCHGSGREPAPLTAGSRRKLKCSGCFLSAKDDYVVDGKMVEHSKALHDSDQLERTISALCGALGIDEWSDAAVYARVALREESARRLGEKGRLSRALAYIAESLARADATESAQAAVKSLLEFHRERHDEPLFTEAGLYDLIGKSDARSVLSRVRDLTTAMGGTES